MEIQQGIKPDELMRSFSYVDFPSFITLDFSPVPADVINEKLVAAAMNMKNPSVRKKKQKGKRISLYQDLLTQSREKKMR